MHAKACFFEEFFKVKNYNEKGLCEGGLRVFSHTKPEVDPAGERVMSPSFIFPIPFEFTPGFGSKKYEKLPTKLQKWHCSF